MQFRSTVSDYTFNYGVQVHLQLVLGLFPLFLHFSQFLVQSLVGRCRPCLRTATTPKRPDVCVDLFVFICVYFVCFCFILHSCCIIVSAVRWTWWD